MKQNNPHQKGINIDLTEEVWEGIYSNFVLVTNSMSEFIVDFGRGMPGINKVKILSRIIMNPQSFKNFTHQLENVLKNYEKQFGEIKMPNKETEERYIGFMKSEQK